MRPLPGGPSISRCGPSSARSTLRAPGACPEHEDGPAGVDGGVAPLPAIDARSGPGGVPGAVPAPRPGPERCAPRCGVRSESRESRGGYMACGPSRGSPAGIRRTAGIPGVQRRVRRAVRVGGACGRVRRAAGVVVRGRRAHRLRADARARAEGAPGVGAVQVGARRGRGGRPSARSARLRASAVDAQRAISDAGWRGPAPARPAAGRTAAARGRRAAPARPSPPRAGVRAPALNRSAQAADTASTEATVPCPAACPPAVRSRRNAVATSPLSIATAPHSRKAMEPRQAASYVAATGEVGEAAGVSARQIRWIPAAAPAPASRAVVSRRNAVPGSPSRTTTVCGPVWARAASATAARSRCGQPGPRGPSSRRRTSSAARASACSRSYARSGRQSCPCVGRRCGSHPSQDHSRRRSSSVRDRSVEIRTISRSNGECSAASCATVARARPASRARGPASPERTGLPQPHGHRHGGHLGPVGRTEPHHQGLRVGRVALPEPGPRTERGQQHGRGSASALGGGGQRGEGEPGEAGEARCPAPDGPPADDADPPGMPEKPAPEP